jgi:hypothetical protein
MLGFLFGALAGGIAGYYWRDRIRDYMSGRGPDLRTRAADRLGTLGDRATGAMDRARSRIDSAVRTGQARLRPTGTTGARQPQAPHRRRERSSEV